MKEFVYTVERVSADDSRLDVYRRADVVDWKRPWAVCINGQPQWMYRSRGGAMAGAGRMVSRNVPGESRKLEVS